jgi:hypothetical protein
MALRRTVPDPVGRLVPLVEVAWAVSPSYNFNGLPSLAAELADVAVGLEMTLAIDWGDRPCVSVEDAARLYRHVTQPRPAPVDPPRRRGHVPGQTFADPSVPRAEVEVY